MFPFKRKFLLMLVNEMKQNEMKQMKICFAKNTQSCTRKMEETASLHCMIDVSTTSSHSFS